MCLRDHAYITTEAGALFPVLTAHQDTVWVQRYDQLPYPAWAAAVRQSLRRQ